MAALYDSPAGEILRLLTHPPYATWRDPNPGRDAVTALDHALICATRALKSLTRPYPDVVVMALVHDAARPLSDAFHGEVIAEIMRGKLHPDCVEALRHHGVFQSDIVHHQREARRLANEPWFALGVALARWDAAGFDPIYEAEPLDTFVPALVEVMSR